MAERLTNTLEETATKGFGLKFCSDRNCNSDEDCCNCYAFNQTINKLRQLEDIMEKYGIDVEELDNKLQNLIFITNTMNDYSITNWEELDTVLKNFSFTKKQEKDREEIYKNMQQDRDTWKRACELACETLKQVMGKPLWIGGNIPAPEVKDTKYFYQQAKKEGNDG